jgi:hypothetical protein
MIGVTFTCSEHSCLCFVIEDKSYFLYHPKPMSSVSLLGKYNMYPDRTKQISIEELRTIWTTLVDSGWESDKKYFK